MLNANLVVFYVQNLSRSINFYTDITGHQPDEMSPNFAVIDLKSGLKLGLWINNLENQPINYEGCTSELIFEVEQQQVEELHHSWKQKNITILQPPTQMDFGYNFIALDPDHHRIRVVASPQN